LDFSDYLWVGLIFKPVTKFGPTGPDHRAGKAVSFWLHWRIFKEGQSAKTAMWKKFLQPKKNPSGDWWRLNWSACSLRL